MDVGGEEAHGGLDAGVEGAAEGQVPAQAHARGADAAVACGQGEQRVDGELRVLVVGRDLLGDLVLVALVGAGPVVGERLRAGELVVRRDGGGDVAVAGDLAGEAGDGPGHYGGGGGIRWEWT